MVRVQHQLLFVMDHRWRVMGRVWHHATQSGRCFRSSRCSPSILADSTVVSLTGDLVRHMASGDTLRVTLNLDDTDSDSNQRRYKRANVRADYQFKSTFGPKGLNAKILAGLTVGYSDFKAYGFFPVAAPGGRQETSVYADVTAVIENVDYAGFVSAVTVRPGRKSSNVSRFDTKELSVSLGIQSNF